MNLSRDDWLELIGIGPEEVPDLIVLEGTWWEAEARDARLAQLDEVRALGVPGMHLGRTKGRLVGYGCAYGAPRAVEPVHAFASVGTRAVVQIGSCGGLQPEVRTGDVVLPGRAVIGEGASRSYGAHGLSPASSRLLGEARGRFEERGLRVHTGLHLTTSSLFMQPEDAVTRWQENGYLGVDMETSAVYSAARHFGMEAVSLLFAWDELLRGRTWNDPFPEDERLRQEEANAATFKVALSLLEVIPA